VTIDGEGVIAHAEGRLAELKAEPFPCHAERPAGQLETTDLMAAG
jgi:hypothetical protein